MSDTVRPRTDSPALSLASQPEAKWNKWIQNLSPEEANELIYHWPFWARPNQTPPEKDWSVWFIMAGRGWGKTRTGAETVKTAITEWGCQRIALVGRTAADVLRVVSP